jgi:hypothetical protein
MMPVFDDDFTFIHIPKSGGTSIEHFLVNQGCSMKLFTATGSVFINGHTPQHCTYRELADLNMLTNKIFTILRPEVDRVISEYFYIKTHRPDLNAYFQTFEEFLDLFLNHENRLMFDFHNLSNKEFLINLEGEISSDIQIIPFFDIPSIEAFLERDGLSYYHAFQTFRTEEIDGKSVARIQEYYEADYFCPHP